MYKIYEDSVTKWFYYVTTPLDKVRGVVSNFKHFKIWRGELPPLPTPYFWCVVYVWFTRHCTLVALTFHIRMLGGTLHEFIQQRNNKLLEEEVRHILLQNLLVLVRVVHIMFLQN